MDHRCNTCGGVKPAWDFYQSNGSHCKSCVRARVKARARANPKVHAYDRARSKTAEKKAAIRKTVKAWRQNNPNAYRAQTALGNALRDGKIKRQPCEVCGAEKVHAHHDDYSRPLEVRWLCPLHHQRHHADTGVSGKNKRAAAGGGA